MIDQSKINEPIIVGKTYIEQVTPKNVQIEQIALKKV